MKKKNETKNQNTETKGKLEISISNNHPKTEKKPNKKQKQKKKKKKQKKQIAPIEYWKDNTIWRFWHKNGKIKKNKKRYFEYSKVQNFVLMLIFIAFS
ncbi:hypothetical protein HYE41_00185 [Mycoplasmopsis bovis]|nr:hypothetical protein [Mycoplasmopsis bovis]QQH20541.1 hypothetical protein HYE41_00185 [Mycoplasmopsis bovis]